MNKLNNILFSLLLISGFGLNSFTAQVDTISIYSASMKKYSKCVVILPESYKIDQGKQFPVVYLLHGYSGNYSNWITKVPALYDYADKYNFIIVCPDGAYSSWYFDSPVDESSRYRTYVGVEVPAWIDSVYQTIPERNSRAIAGLSMGGHGAIYLAWNFPKTFGAAGSMSGAVDLVPWKSKYSLGKLLGDTSNNNSFYNYSAINVVKRPLSKFPMLMIDCGIEDPFINDNRSLHNQLMSLQIPHDYIERPGKHNWAYWQNSVRYQLFFFHEFFEMQPGE